MVTVGIQLPDAPTTQDPLEELDELLALVDAAQSAGVTYFVVGQHVLYGDWRWLQPIPLLSRLAAELEPHARVGTNVVVAPLYHPVVLAEELATLDVMTRGRLSVGVGPGYRPEVFAALGVPYHERVSRFEESVELLKALWVQDEVNHLGSHHRLDGVRPDTRPVQSPRPPLWVGATGERGVRRAARIADAWSIPPKLTIEEVARLIGAFDDERGAGAPRAMHPFRREVMIGSDRASALGELARLARTRYEVLAAKDYARLPGALDLSGDLSSRMEELMAVQAVVGTEQECIDQLVGLGSTLPVDPIIVRPRWSGTPLRRAIGYLERLGDQVIPALSEVEPHVD